MFSEVLHVFRAPFPDSSDVRLTHTATQNGSKSQKEKPLIRIEIQIFKKSYPDTPDAPDAPVPILVVHVVYCRYSQSGTVSMQLYQNLLLYQKSSLV